MMEQALLWLKFLSGAALIVGAGLMLTRSTERLAKALGWGHAFAGFVILGWATSLPELTISVSAVETVGSAGLSAGNITGSLIFNLAILAALDLLARKRHIRDAAGLSGLPPLAVFNLILIAGALLLALRPDLNRGPQAWLGGAGFLAVYVLAALFSWRSERDAPAASTDGAADPPGGSTAAAGLRCLLAGVVIVFAGMWLTQLGEAIAKTYALQEGLVGTVFLATVSSLPELVTGIVAVNLGLHTMAAGSILGSNIFNMGILGLCDLLFQAGPGNGEGILAAAVTSEPGRIVGNLLAIGAMTILALLHTRRQARVPTHGPSVGWPALTLVIYLWVLALA